MNMMRFYLVGVLLSALEVNAKTLSGKYCGSNSIMDMDIAKLASVISSQKTHPWRASTFLLIMTCLPSHMELGTNSQTVGTW